MHYFNKDNFIIKKRVYLGDVLFEAAPEKAFIDLREPEIDDFMRLKRIVQKQRSGSADNDEVSDEMIETLREMIPRIFIAHNVMKNETDKMTDDEMIDIIQKTPRLIFRVMLEYKETIFLSLGKGLNVKSEGGELKGSHQPTSGESK